MNKPHLISKIVAALTAELENYARAARAAHAEATDGQSKAENKYDTRGLEASYLAHAQSEQAAAVEQAIQLYQSFAARPFTAAEPIGPGAVVEVEQRGARTVYFLGPAAGGLEVEGEAGRSVLVITPQSPLGRQLIGQRADTAIRLTLGRAVENARIVAVS